MNGIGFGSTSLRRLRRGAAGRATLAAFVWATIAGPALHLFDHREDHVHGEGGAIRWARSDRHHHGDGRWHRHGRPEPEGRGAPAGPALAPDLEDASMPGPHGDGAADHFGAAFLDAPAVAAPPPVVGPEKIEAVAARRVLTGRAVRDHLSRGPPLRVV